MSIIEHLFSKSPFAPLQTHMEKVAKCVKELAPLFASFTAMEHKKIKTFVERISELEHSADMTKNDIRNNLPRGLFLAINRSDILDILSLQDSIADTAEDIGVLMTLKKLDPIEEISGDLKKFLDKNIQAVQLVHSIIHELERLLESTFGGKEAKKVRVMVAEVAIMEHEADIMQRKILKKLYNLDSDLEYSSFNLWLNILQEIAALGNISERLANKISMLLEIQ